jgi:hypothetical protein
MKEFTCNSERRNIAMSIGPSNVKIEDKGGGIELKRILKEQDKRYVDWIDLDQRTSYIELF